MECIVNCVLSSLLIWGVALHLTRIATEMLTNVVSMGDPELSRLMYEPLVYMQVLQMLLHDPYLRVKNRRSMCTAQNMSAWGFERHVTSASNSSSPSEMPFFMENVNAANSTVNATDSSFSPRNGDAFSSESDFTTEEYLTELGRLPVDWKFKAVSVNDQLQLEGSFADLRRGKQVLEMKKLRLAALLQEIQTRSDGFGHSMATAVSWYNSVTGTARGASYVVLPLQAMAGQFQFLADGLAAQLADVTRTLNLYEQSPGFRGPGMDLFGNPSSFPHTHTGDGQAQNSQDGAKQLSTGTFQDQEQPWRPQRGLPERAVKVLRAWLFENFLHPYPKDAEKVLLARQTGLSRNQVSNWFINARVRLWKPMVEDMYEDNIPQGDPESPEVPYDFRLDYHKFSFPAQDHSSNSHLPMNLVPSEPSQFEFFSAATHDHMVSNHHTLGSAEAMVIRGQGFLPNLYTGTDSSRSDTGALFGSSSKDLGYDWNHQPNLMSPSNPGVSAFASPLGEAFTRFHSGSNSDFQIGPGSGFVSNLNDFPMTAHGVSLTLGLRHPDLSAFHGEADSQPANEDDPGYSTEISMSPPRYASNRSEVLYNTISGATPGPTHYLPQEEVLGSSTMNFMQLGTAGNEVNVPLTLSPMGHGHSNPEEQDLYDLTRR